MFLIVIFSVSKDIQFIIMFEKVNRKWLKWLSDYGKLFPISQSKLFAFSQSMNRVHEITVTALHQLKNRTNICSSCLRSALKRYITKFWKSFLGPFWIYIHGDFFFSPPPTEDKPKDVTQARVPASCPSTCLSCQHFCPRSLIVLH